MCETATARAIRACRKDPRMRQTVVNPPDRTDEAYRFGALDAAALFLLVLLVALAPLVSG